MTTPSVEDRVKAIEEVVGQLIDRVEAIAKDNETLKRTAVKKSTGLFGGKRERTAMKDTKTGTIYPSKAALGKALAEEADTDGLDHFAYYKLMAKFPDRFVSATEEEAKKAWAEEEARIAKEVEESNKRLAAEAEAKAKAEAKK